MSSSSDNTNQTLLECLNENFGNTTIDCSRCYNLNERASWLLYIHVIIVAVIVVASLIGSLLVFLLIMKYKKLRHRAAMISLSVIIADTALVFTYHVPVIISTLHTDWIFEFIGCQVFGFLSTNFIFTRWFIMGVLALDRFCLVRFPFSYSKWEKYILLCLITLSWVLPAFVSVGLISGFASVAFRQNVPTCLSYTPTVGKGRVLYSIMVTLAFAIGGILPTTLYIWLFWRARKLRPSAVRVGQMGLNSIEDPASQPDGNFNSSEKRAIITFALIFVTFFMTGLPAYSFQILRSVNVDLWCKIPPILQFFAVELFLSSTALDPFLVMRDRDFRKRLKHMLFCRNNCGRYYANTSAIYPQLPAERDISALRSIAVRALNLISLPNLRANVNSADTDNSTRPFRSRSGSAPAQYLATSIPRLKRQEGIPDESGASASRNNKTEHVRVSMNSLDVIEEDCNSTSESTTCSENLATPELERDMHGNCGSSVSSCGIDEIQVHNLQQAEITYTYGNNMQCTEIQIEFVD